MVTFNSQSPDVGLTSEQILFFTPPPPCPCLTLKTASSFSLFFHKSFFFYLHLPVCSLCPVTFKSLLVHQLPNLPNLAVWSSERICVMLGNLQQDPLLPLSQPFLSVTFLSLIPHCIFHRDRHECTQTHARIHDD